MSLHLASQKGGPLFATVSLCGARADDVIATLRVPIAPDTTIRQLAKGAMQRLAVSRRGGATASLPKMMVTGVFVGGGAQPKAEVFSHDLVSHVVLLREEIVYLRLHCSSDNGEGEVTLLKRDLHNDVHESEKGTEHQRVVAPSNRLTPVKSSAPSVSPKKTELSVKAVETTAPKPAVNSSRKRESSPEEEEIVKTPRRPLTRRAAKRQRGELTPEELEQTAKQASKHILSTSSKTHLGWGPKAFEHFPENYVSSPEKLMRRRRTKNNGKQKVEETISLTSASGCTENDKGSKVADKTAIEVRDRESSPPAKRPGWGPEAYKNFAANFVNSPDRYAKELRMKKKREEEEQKRLKEEAARKQAESSNPHTVISDDDEVARRLVFDGEGGDARARVRPVVYGDSSVEPLQSRPLNSLEKDHGKTCSSSNVIGNPHIALSRASSSAV